MSFFIKMCIVGGIGYMMCDASYQLGKGRILGFLAKTNVSASQCIDAISDDKRLRVKLVKMIAKITEKKPLLGLLLFPRKKHILLWKTKHYSLSIKGEL